MRTRRICDYVGGLTSASLRCVARGRLDAVSVGGGACRRALRASSAARRATTVCDSFRASLGSSTPRWSSRSVGSASRGSARFRRSCGKHAASRRHHRRHGNGERQGLGGAAAGARRQGALPRASAPAILLPPVWTGASREVMTCRQRLVEEGGQGSTPHHGGNGSPAPRKRSLLFGPATQGRAGSKTSRARIHDRRTMAGVGPRSAAVQVHGSFVCSTSHTHPSCRDANRPLHVCCTC